MYGDRERGGERGGGGGERERGREGEREGGAVKVHCVSVHTVTVKCQKFTDGNTGNAISHASKTIPTSPYQEISPSRVININQFKKC